MKKLFFKITGGRPMKCLESCQFVDCVSGESVGLYKDWFGRTWLATGSWSGFRVPKQVDNEA